MDNYKNGGISGLTNFGNTCFMNSALQCFSHTYDLRKFFLTDNYKTFLNDNEYIELSTQYYRLLNGLWENNCTVTPISFFKTVKTLAIKNNVNFTSNIQNDIQEFLIFFMDMMHESLKNKLILPFHNSKTITKLEKESIKTWTNFFDNNYSVIIELFYGQILTKIKDFDDNVLTTKFDPIGIFSLPLPSNDNLTIIDCFKEFIKEEILEGDNMWKNDKTNEYMKVKKSIELWKMPEYLICSFNRFNNNQQKIDKFINYPLILDLSEIYNSDNCSYELYGICNHIGETMGGHYYSMNKHNNIWYTFNDSSIKKTKNTDLINKNAYCLFYKKC